MRLPKSRVVVVVVVVVVDVVDGVEAVKAADDVEDTRSVNANSNAVSDGGHSGSDMARVR